MKNVVTYARVSTDEQGRLGYSLSEQDNKFTDWAAKQPDIHIAARFKDDASGKSFNRPDWIRLEAFVKTNRHIDGIVVVVWDRFSRNTNEAYATLAKFQKLNIEINALEQWIDFDVPEQEMMLAIYVTGAQIYNRRLSIRVTEGMRRAMKEGRWMGSAPIGYDNARDAQGKPIIVPGSKAPIITELFSDFAKGIYTAEDMRQKYSHVGMNRCKNAIADLLKNPVYIGKIRIKSYRNDPAKIVDGIHQPLIDEATFNQVQSVLNGRKRAPYISADAELPLRGFLVCHQCGDKLTGSGSKGNGGKYYYYHCQYECRERFGAIMANSIFEELLGKMTPRPEQFELMKRVLADIFQDKEKSAKRSMQQINREMAELQNDMMSLDEKFIKNQISKDRYDKMNRMLDGQLSMLRARKIDAEILEKEFMQILNFGLNLVGRLDYHYKAADLEGKRQIIGSIFPQSLIFHEKKYRTIRNNELISIFDRFSQRVDSTPHLSNQNTVFSEQFIADVNLFAKVREFVMISPGSIVFLP